MLYYAAVFLLIAIIAAVFGFGGIAAGAAGIAKILFVLFLIGAIITFVMSGDESDGRGEAPLKSKETFMESTANDLDREHTRNGEAFRTASTRQAVRDEVRRLMEDVEELIRRVGDAADPEIARLRSKVEAAISTTKEAIASRTERVQQHARDTFAAGDSYVHEQPWRAVGIAAFIGMVVGFLAARR